MKTENVLKQLVYQVSKLQTDMSSIKAFIVEMEDRVLSEEDISAIQKGEQEFQNGDTISHEELKAQLGV